MPIYEYVCDDCQLKFELLKPMSQSAQSVSCPNCGGSARRALSKFARSSNGSDSSGGGSACGTCSSDSCGTCSL